MNMDKSEGRKSKSDLRQKIRAGLGKISLAVRMAESLELCARLEPQLQSAHTILFFAPLPDELDVWPLLEKLLPAKKICALPAFDEAVAEFAVAYAAQTVLDHQALLKAIRSGRLPVAE